MKKVADKQILMAADFAGYPLKEAIKEDLEKKGWTVTDIGVKADSDPEDTELMFHRIGLRADAFLYNDFGSGWEWWPDFDKFHQIAIDELNAFNYEEYKANGFKVKHLGDCHCELYDRPEGFSSVPLMVKR